MQKYDKWRKEFYDNELYDETYMCFSHSIKECSKQENKDMAYLPKPNEYELWKKLYESLKKNNESETKKDLKQLTHIQDFSQLIDYCYGEVKEAIRKNKEEKKSDYFNAGGSSVDTSKAHERCTFSWEDLQKLEI